MQSCLEKACLPVTSYYCTNGWSDCSINETKSTCENQSCINIAIGIRYLFIHNGTEGIKNVSVYYKLGNVTNSFYQEFEVTFEWNGTSRDKVFIRSGNPGYQIGKPLIIGKLLKNVGNQKGENFALNKPNPHLTLPFAERNGNCRDDSRYSVLFGENLKIKCGIVVEVENFATDACEEIQEKSISYLLNALSTEQAFRDVYVSKFGNFVYNDTSNWIKVLLNSSSNIIRSKRIESSLLCSDLTTSYYIDVVYSRLSRMTHLDNYEILGIGVTLKNESRTFTAKCTQFNCTDTFRMDLTSYVSFHDKTKPPAYHFAGVPNIDISVPYDFFYPFIRDSATSNFSSLHSLLIVICVLFYMVIYLEFN